MINKEEINQKEILKVLRDNRDKAEELKTEALTEELEDNDNGGCDKCKNGPVSWYYCSQCGKKLNNNLTFFVSEDFSLCGWGLKKDNNSYYIYNKYYVNLKGKRIEYSPKEGKIKFIESLENIYFYPPFYIKLGNQKVEIFLVEDLIDFKEEKKEKISPLITLEQANILVPNKNNKCISVYFEKNGEKIEVYYLRLNNSESFAVYKCLLGWDSEQLKKMEENVIDTLRLRGDLQERVLIKINNKLILTEEKGKGVAWLEDREDDIDEKSIKDHSVVKYLISKDIWKIKEK